MPVRELPVGEGGVTIVSIHFAPGLALPAEAVTETFGILGVRGSGKSNAAAVLVEGFAEAELPFCVIDPVGAWWGLRSSRSGKGPGLGVPIFGGLHGDFPLGAGEELADILAEMSLSCVVDVSELSEGEKKRYLTAFAERLYRQKAKQASPLHLVLEEADDYAPQRPFRDEARLLRAWENIVRRGRMRGLGITMITQRSASLNKNLLTQIGTLIVMRTTSPQDRKAVLAWVDYHGQGHELVDSLPAMKPGEGWVWSPQFLDRMERVQFPRRHTFDSAATPKMAKGARPAVTLAEVDAPAIRERLAASIEKAKADDPRELRKQIASLRVQVRELESRRPETPAPERIEVPMLTEKEQHKIGGFIAKLDKFEERFLKASKGLYEKAAALRVGLSRILSKIEFPPPLPKPAAPPAARPMTRDQGNRREGVATTEGAEGFSKREMKALAALAQLEQVQRGPISNARLAVYCGWPQNGTYFNALSSLSGKSLIDRSERGAIALTAAGRAAAGPPEKPLTHEELMRFWGGRLPGREGKVLDFLAGRPGEDVPNGTLAAAFGWPENGTFFNTLSKLSGLGVVDRSRRGFVKASAMLWP